jgi:hypothetical protein
VSMVYALVIFQPLWLTLKVVALGTALPLLFLWPLRMLSNLPNRIVISRRERSADMS